jgi:hypothetical protein
MKVTLITEINLKLLAYYLRHLGCMLSTLGVTRISLNKIWSKAFHDRHLRPLNHLPVTMGHQDVQEIDQQDWPHILTVMLEHDYSCPSSGSLYLPDKYVPPAPLHAPPLAIPSARAVAPHQDPSLWSGIGALLRNQQSWPLIQPYAQACHASRASWAMDNHLKQPGLIKAARVQRKSKKFSFLHLAWHTKLRRQHHTNKAA